MNILLKHLRSVVATAATAMMICSCTDLSGGCVIGPCGTYGEVPVTLVVGIPAQRVANGEGHLSVGDTLVLYAVNVAQNETACTARDTIHTAVQWASSDPNIATASVGSRGEARIVAKKPGAFGVVMYTPFTGTIPATALVNPIYTCPSPTQAVSSIRVAATP